MVSKLAPFTNFKGYIDEFFKMCTCVQMLFCSYTKFYKFGYSLTVGLYSIFKHTLLLFL